MLQASTPKLEILWTEFWASEGHVLRRADSSVLKSSSHSQKRFCPSYFDICQFASGAPHMITKFDLISHEQYAWALYWASLVWLVNWQYIPDTLHNIGKRISSRIRDQARGQNAHRFEKKKLPRLILVCLGQRSLRQSAVPAANKYVNERNWTRKIPERNTPVFFGLSCSVARLWSSASNEILVALQPG